MFYMSEALSAMYLSGSLQYSTRIPFKLKKYEVFRIFEANSFPSLINLTWEEGDFIKFLSFFTDEVLLLEEGIFPS